MNSRQSVEPQLNCFLSFPKTDVSPQFQINMEIWPTNIQIWLRIAVPFNLYRGKKTTKVFIEIIVKKHKKSISQSLLNVLITELDKV